MDVVSVVCLSSIMGVGLFVNGLALLFLAYKKGTKTMKDKVLIMLSWINAMQSVGFGMELNAAIEGKSTTTLCEISTFLICSLTYTSIGYFVILTIERQVAIVHPFQYNTWFSSARSVIWLLAAPLYGFSIGVIPLLGWSGYAKPHNNSIYCTFNFKLQNTKSFFIVALALAFVGPVLVVAGCFRSVIVELKRSLVRTRTKHGRQSVITKESAKALNGQSLSSLLTGVIFIGSWLPYSAVCFCYFMDQKVSKDLEYFSKFLSKSSTISSTVVFCLIERSFRCFLCDKLCVKIFKTNRKNRLMKRRGGREISTAGYSTAGETFL